MNHNYNDEHKIEETHVDKEEQREEEVGSQDFVKKIEACEQEALHWKSQYLRISADFENFKKRLEKERMQMSRIIKKNILSELLVIVDNFERALTVKYQVATQDMLQGFEMIYKDLVVFFKKQGVQEMVVDKSFDPEYHEAIMCVASDLHQSGEIVEVVQKGYLLDGEVLRPAKVSIAE